MVLHVDCRRRHLQHLQQVVVVVVNKGISYGIISSTCLSLRVNRPFWSAPLDIATIINITTMLLQHNSFQHLRSPWCCWPWVPSME